jgi:hypothetical protein
MNMPPRKAGYKRVLVVRGGKKKWINKRVNGRRVILSAKQRQALRKARLKAHTSRAEIHRQKSDRLRKRFGLD